MITYSYEAINAAGKRVKGVLHASNPAELELSLKQVGQDLISFKPRTARVTRKNIRRRELITFFFNMEQLYRAGIPLLECLRSLQGSLESRTLAGAITDMIKSIEGGASLFQAMALHDHLFDRTTLHLIQAGEKSGKLAEIFKYLTASLKWQDEIAAQGKNILIYPAFAGLLILAVLLFLMVYLVPQLAALFHSMGQTIPVQTAALLAASEFLNHYWPELFITLLILFVIYQLIRTRLPDMQLHIDTLKLRLWPTGKILQKIVLARFAHTFSLMYGAGISVLDCLESARDLSGNRLIAARMEQVIQEVKAGTQLSQGFQEAGIFPPLVIRMIKVGETTGRVDLALENISYFYDRDVKESVHNLQAMLSPAITLALGLLLGCVMLLALSPVYDPLEKI